MFTFHIFGHKNTLATHKNTIEFTKSPDLSKRGDCILGIKADFDYNKLKEFIKEKKKLIITINAGRFTDSFESNINDRFQDTHEIVFRRSRFISERTLGIEATKTAIDINRNIVDYLKNPNNKATITFKNQDEKTPEK